MSRPSLQTRLKKYSFSLKIAHLAGGCETGQILTHTISATVPLGTPGRVRSICLLSVVFYLIFLVLRGPHAPHPFLPALTRVTRFSHFLSLFFKPHFLRELVPKGLKMGAPKQPKITKIYKKSSSKRIRNQGLQKDSVWKGSNL